jgi:hypothetical protein
MQNVMIKNDEDNSGKRPSFAPTPPPPVYDGRYQQQIAPVQLLCEIDEVSGCQVIIVYKP